MNQPEQLDAYYQDISVQLISGLEELAVHPENHNIQRILTEIDDDPAITLDSLTAEERDRLSFRFVAALHIPHFAPDIAEAIGAVDYYILEDVLGRESLMRQAEDARMNLIAQGIAVRLVAVGPMGFVKTPAEVSFEESDPFTTAYARSAYFRHAEKPPIFRGMDVTVTDQIPGTPLRYVDLERVRYTAFSKIRLAQYLESNQELADLKQTYLALDGFWATSRDQRQYQDISRIAANAVRRHPGQNIVVGVMAGKNHDTVAQRIMQEHDVNATLTYVPNITDAQGRLVRSPSYLAEQELLTTGQITAKALGRLILYNYIDIVAIDLEIGSTKAMMLSESTIASLADDEVTELLQAIDLFKPERKFKPGLLRGFRRFRISRFLLKHPTVVNAMYAASERLIALERD